MSANPYKPLTDLLLPGVDLFQSPADFMSRTGQPCPFDPAQDIKYWQDLSAATGPARTKAYLNALVMGDGNKPLAGPDGNPMLGPLVLKREVAAAVNIPSGAANAPSSAFTVPFPIRPLLRAERLVFMGLAGTVAIRDTTAPLPEPAPGDGFNSDDRALLERIAETLGM